MTLVWVVLGLFGAAALVLALATALLPARRAAIRELWWAWLAEVPVVGLLLVPAYLGGWAWFAAVALLACGATLDLLGVRGSSPPLQRSICLVACALCLVLAEARGMTPLVLLAPALGAGLLLIGWAAPGGRVAWRRGLPVAGLALLYPCLPLVGLLWVNRTPHGFESVVFLVGVVEAHDCLCMVSGKLGGERKIFPRLSPHKTWVGSAGGLAAALLAAAALSPVMPHLDLTHCLLGGAVMVVAAVAGDLVASGIKRWAGAKDFPRTLGLPWLDTYDALVLGGPVFYTFLVGVGVA